MWMNVKDAEYFLMSNVKGHDDPLLAGFQSSFCPRAFVSASLYFVLAPREGCGRPKVT